MPVTVVATLLSGANALAQGRLRSMEMEAEDQLMMRLGFEVLLLELLIALRATRLCVD